MLLFIRICLSLRVELYNSVAIFFTQSQSVKLKVTDKVVKVVKLLLIESFKISCLCAYNILLICDPSCYVCN